MGLLLALQLFLLLGVSHARVLGRSLQQEVLAPQLPLPDLYEVSIAELQDGLQRQRFSSVDLVQAYLERIEEVNLKGPALRAVIEINPSATTEALKLDAERHRGGTRGPLHGIPILVKDNIATDASQGMNTTAGSYALLGSIPPRDAHVVKRLRDAGAIIFGKTNLAEWSHARGDTVPSGWSARGGQPTNPYLPLGETCGSSSGSGISSAIGLAAAALGTETDGSIVCPSSYNNLVGIKPTVGLTSRAGVIPITSHQDTVGPLARSVADAVAILSAMAGPDARDNYTLAQPRNLPNYTEALQADGLRGVRLGVPRKLVERADSAMVQAFNASLDTFRRLGATIVDPADYPAFDELMEVHDSEVLAGRADLKYEIKKYIANLLDVPTGVKDLFDIVTFNLVHADKELVEPYWTDQSIMIEALNSTMDQAYYDAVAYNHDLGATRGIDATLELHNLDALILPTNVASQVSAIAGYPLVTVPLGFLPPDTELAPAKPTRERGPNMPFGIAFSGTAFSEYDLIKYAYAYEQATHTRLQVLAYSDAIPKTQLVDILGRK